MSCTLLYRRQTVSGDMQGRQGRSCPIGLGHDLRNGGDLPKRPLAKRTEREEISSRAAIGTLNLTIACDGEPQMMGVGTGKALTNEI